MISSSILLCILGELPGGGFAVVFFVVSDIWQVTGSTWHLTYVTWLFLIIFFISQHIERFSVSCIWDFFITNSRSYCHVMRTFWCKGFNFNWFASDSQKNSLTDSLTNSLAETLTDSLTNPLNCCLYALPLAYNLGVGCIDKIRSIHQ